MTKTTHTEGDAQVRVVATAFLGLRPWIVGPFFVFTLATLAWGGAPRFQLLALGAGTSLMLGFFSFERVRGRTNVFGSRWLLSSLLLTITGITLASALTGATNSPLLPMLFAPAGVGFAAFGRSRASSAVVAATACAISLLALLAPWVTALSVAEPARRVVLAAAVVDAALLLRVGVANLAEAHARAARTLSVAGDELVRAAESRSRSLEALGARVSHEVKNPLSAIRALVELMLENSDDRTRRRLTVAAAEVARIEQILDAHGKIAQPFEALRRAPTDIPELVGSLVDVLGARAERAGVTLAIDPLSRAATFSVDRDRAKEALLNVTLNALDATSAGGSVTLRYGLRDDGALEICVADTGKGMSQATLAKLGTPYFTEREGGTGLGVALSRRVCEQHGGQLDYESEKGHGTRATLSFSVGTPGSDD